VRREYSDEVPENRVIETSPSERSRLERGSTVTLVVSRGQRQAEVPSVIGRDRAEAARQLEARGLQVSVTEREDESREPGIVLAQDPAAGREVEQGTTVTITVAKAPAPIAVPDVIGQSADAAAGALRAAGFTVQRRREDVDTLQDDDKVLDQSPGSGEQRDKGSRVIITVGRFEPPNLDPDPGATPAPTP
jgi:serine/threonine-protein kinase